jgi:hypothetical protein
MVMLTALTWRPALPGRVVRRASPRWCTAPAVASWRWRSRPPRWPAGMARVARRSAPWRHAWPSRWAAVRPHRWTAPGLRRAHGRTAAPAVATRGHLLRVHLLWVLLVVRCGLGTPSRPPSSTIRARARRHGRLVLTVGERHLESLAGTVFTRFDVFFGVPRALGAVEHDGGDAQGLARLAVLLELDTADGAIRAPHLACSRHR